MTPTRISETASTDLPALLALYLLAFPQEDLCPLVSALLALPEDVASLMVRLDDQLVGHAIFTLGKTGQGDKVALLGPVAIHPQQQRKGLGTALISGGLASLGARGVGQCCVLGDPAYYGRFGFVPERKITTPFPIPPDWTEAWQSIRLTDTGIPAARGKLHLPVPWMKAELWTA